MLQSQQAADEPIAARALAERCQIGGNPENQRRRIREAVQAARNAGTRVCADADGYWIARNAGEWHDYLAALRSGARFSFVRVKIAETAVVERFAGQGRLFDAEPWWGREPERKTFKRRNV